MEMLSSQYNCSSVRSCVYEYPTIEGLLSYSNNTKRNEKVRKVIFDPGWEIGSGSGNKTYIKQIPNIANKQEKIIKSKKKSVRENNNCYSFDSPALHYRAVLFGIEGDAIVTNTSKLPSLYSIPKTARRR